MVERVFQSSTKGFFEREFQLSWKFTDKEKPKIFSKRLVVESLPIFRAHPPDFLPDGLSSAFLDFRSLSPESADIQCFYLQLLERPEVLQGIKANGKRVESEPK